MSTSLPASQLSPHGATRVDLPGPYGPLAALHAPPAKVAGDGTREHPVTALLIPGYTGSKEDFAPLIDPIAESGIEVIAIDLPGQYESPGPDEESQYRPGPLGVFLAELLGWLTDGAGPGATPWEEAGAGLANGHMVRPHGKRRLLLLGHSYGGLVARATALAGAPIAGLTLLGSGPGELPDGERRQALDDGEALLRANGIEAALRTREMRYATKPHWAQTPQELRTLLRERFLRSSAAGLLGMADGLRYEPDLVVHLRRALRAKSAPCLVVCGQHDDAWPVAIQHDMAERLDADFAVVPQAAHSPNTENPDALLATLLPTWRSWLRG